MPMHLPSWVAIVIALAAAASAQTWTYDADPGQEPNGAGQPFEGGTVGGGNSTRSFVDLGGGDLVYQINTIDPNSDAGSYFEQGDGPKWNVSNAAGHTTEWRVHLDGILGCEDGAADLLTCDGTVFPVLRLTRSAGGAVRVRLMSLFGTGIVDYYVGNPDWFHTYRLDVQGGNARVYVDDYPFPVLSSANITGGPGNYDFIRFGDGTGSGDGKHQTQFLRSWQSAVRPSPAAPSPLDASYTLFLAHYDGNTGNAGLNADFAAGGTAAVGTGGQIGTQARFGAGSLDGYGPSGTVDYQTAGNLQPAAGTVEMWIRPANWSDGSYQGFFSATRPTASEGDIRIQKTSANALEAIMGGVGYTQVWALNSGPLNLTSDWHHIAWTWDFNANKSFLYVDGTVVAGTVSLTGLATLGFNGVLNPTFEVGSIQNGSGAFAGMIDEFRISDRDLYGGQGFTPPGAAFPTPTGPANGACCQPNGTCIEATYAACIAGRGEWHGLGSSCAATACTTGACCLPDGTCSELTATGCAAEAGIYHGDGTGCGSYACNTTGACCLPNGACEQATRADCLNRDGTYGGDGVGCVVGACTPVATWVYNPDQGRFPNEAPEPFASPGYQFGGNGYRSLVDLGAGDLVLRINTSPTPPGLGDPAYNRSIGWELDAPSPAWNVSSTIGYSVEWRMRLDAGTPTNPSAAGLFAGNATNYAFLRVYNGEGFPPVTGPVRAGLLDSTGNAGQAIHYIPDGTAWHTYRVDVKDTTARLFLDKYPFPVLTRTLAAGGANAVWFGDGTGYDNGLYDVDYVASYQSGPLGIRNAPDPGSTSYTQFLAHYDGNTAQGGLTADFAVGSPDAIGLGGAVSGTARYGNGSLDQYNSSGMVSYATPGNYTVRRGTLEMWIKPASWADNAYAGFFDMVLDSSNSAIGDIRLQKTSANSLQAGMNWTQGATLYSWSLTSAPLVLSSNWHHIAWTWDLDANRSAIYVDGAVVDDTVALYNLSAIAYDYDLAGRMQIGSVQSNSAPFNGLIDDLRISGVDLYGGQPYTLPVLAHAIPAGQPTGACCDQNRSCADTTFAACPGTWQGAGTNCADNRCPAPPTGACCIPGELAATCQDLSQAACAAMGGRYQGDHTVCASTSCCNPPSVTDVSHTMFLTHYDGNTAQGGLTADYATGDPASSGTGGAVAASPMKFGAGSLDPAAGVLTYSSLDNFKVDSGTVEMWIQTDRWADGSFNGLFSIYEAGVGDIRLQKTNGGRLQAYMGDLSQNQSWSVTSDVLSPDASWHHVAWTWDFASQKTALYLDGTVVAGAPAFGGITELQFNAPLPQRMEVGTVQGGSADFPGYIDEFRITDKDLYCSANFLPATSPWPTPPPGSARGACCRKDLGCERLTQSQCTAIAGTYMGSFTECGSVVCERNPFADRDGDLDVDMDDFARFQRCINLSGPLPAACEVFDRPETGFPNGDGDVDLIDAAAFAACASGAGVPADTACDGLP